MAVFFSCRDFYFFTGYKFHFESNWQRSAADFALREGTPIRAALDGIVTQVIDGFGPGGPDKSFLSQCNLVIIGHPHSEYSTYVHLKKGCLVREGEEVSAGKVIGYSGRSGYSTYSHLHFAVIRNQKTIPTQFKLKEEIYTLVSPRE